MSSWQNKMAGGAAAISLSAVHVYPESSNDSRIILNEEGKACQKGFFCHWLQEVFKKCQALFIDALYCKLCSRSLDQFYVVSL